MRRRRQPRRFAAIARPHADIDPETATIDKVTGVQTLYLVFAGGEGVASIDSFRFS